MLCRQNFCILSTVNSKGEPHATGVLFAFAPANQSFHLYIVTSRKYAKTKHIKRNPSVSVVIPFPHHWFRAVPAPTIQFQGTAEIISIEDPLAVEYFMRSKILKMTYEQILAASSEDAVFLRVTPKRFLYCHGVGIGLLQMRKDIKSGAYRIELTND